MVKTGVVIICPSNAGKPITVQGVITRTARQGIAVCPANQKVRKNTPRQRIITTATKQHILVSVLAYYPSVFVLTPKAAAPVLRQHDLGAIASNRTGNQHIITRTAVSQVHKRNAVIALLTKKDKVPRIYRRLNAA